MLVEGTNRRRAQERAEDRRAPWRRRFALLEVAMATEKWDRDREDGDALANEPLLMSLVEKKPTKRWRKEAIALALVLVLVMCVHVAFVLLLRKTTYQLHQLTVPDMCHAQSNGAVVLHFDNPSYCSPQVGHVRISISKNTTALLELALPAFDLPSGKSTVVSTMAFNLLASPQDVYDLVFQRDGNYSVHGDAVVHISCLLIPFSVTLGLGHAPSQHKHFPVYGSAVHGFDGDMIRKEVDRLIQQILKSIALSHIHTESDNNELFAYTDVTFSYKASVLWNVPSLALKLQTESRDTILKAGVKRFLLGNGETFLSAFSEIYKNESKPLQDILQKYLGGKDVDLHVSGGNAGSSCLSLQLLDLVDVRVKVPAKIDGEPALLRHYSVQPQLKELDSKTHTCLLQLDVLLTLNNPLPIRFELFELSFDLLYRNHSSTTSKPIPLTRIDDVSAVTWHPHDVRNVSISTEIREFAVCLDLVKVYLKDQLAFSLDAGRIRMAAGSGNFSIPFHVPEIPIHPSQASTGSEISSIQ